MDGCDAYKSGDNQDNNVKKERRLEIGTVNTASRGDGERQDSVPTTVGSSDETKDVTDSHEQREICISYAIPSLILPGEISEESTTGPLSHVVGDVKKPKPKNEGNDGEGPGGGSRVVAKDDTDVSGVTDDDDGDGDGGCAGDDEGSATAEG